MTLRVILPFQQRVKTLAQANEQALKWLVPSYWVLYYHLLTCYIYAFIQQFPKFPMLNDKNVTWSPRVNRIQSKNHKIGPPGSEAFWAASHSVTRSTNSFSKRWIALLDAIAGNTTSLSNSRFLKPCAQKQPPCKCKSPTHSPTSQYITDPNIRMEIALTPHRPGWTECGPLLVKRNSHHENDLCCLWGQQNNF
jgi:hypothetical protein